MRILFTGSEGSLGQIVIPEFINAGHEVVGIDNLSRYGAAEKKRPYRFSQGDLTDTAGVRGIFARDDYDLVFHAAAIIYGVVGFHKKPADILGDNNLMTMNLLKYGQGHIGKFVYLSSSMVYEMCRQWPHKEEDADSSPVMSTSYGLSKYVGERVVRSFHEQYGMTYTIWRPFNIITPFEAPQEEGVSHVFADMIRKIIIERQQPLEVLGDGQQVRCFTSIFDVAGAIARFSLDKRSDNEIFNIANAEPITVIQLTELIAELGKEMGVLPQSYKLEYRHLPIYGDDVRRRIPDVSKIKRVFGWEAKTKVRESLRQCIEQQCLRK
jgi:UDP-glucose 4-epimerase